MVYVETKIPAGVVKHSFACDENLEMLFGSTSDQNLNSLVHCSTDTEELQRTNTDF